MCFLVGLRPIAGYGFFIHEVSRSHTTTHHIREDSSGLVLSLSQRPLPDNTQHSQQTDIQKTPLDERSARRRDLYLTTHDTHNRQISMPPVGFEPTISAGARPQTYALERAATGTGNR